MVSKLRVNELESLDAAANVTVQQIADAVSASQPVDGKLDFVSSRSELSARSATAGEVVFLADGLRSGAFTFLSLDMSTLVSQDPNEGVVIAPDSDSTGASGAWYRVAANNSLSVTWFGAVGNGSVDDTSAINACIAFARTGDTIEFPGTVDYFYKTSGPINVDKRVHVVGGQVRIRCTSGNCFEITAADAVVEGFYLQGTHAESNHIAIRIGADHVTVRDIYAEEFEKGFEVWGGVWPRLEKIRMRNMRIHVGTIGNVVGTVVEDLRYDTDTSSFSVPTNGGIILKGEGCNFSDLDIINAGPACVYIVSDQRESIWNFFNSCSFDTSECGVKIAALGSSNSIRGIMFDHCWFSSHTTQGVVLEGHYNLEGVTFNGCHFLNNGQGAISIEQAATEIVVEGCVFSSNSQQASGSYSHIIHNSIGDVYVLNNIFSAWGQSTSTNFAAVERTSTNGYLVVDGNYAKPSENTKGVDYQYSAPNAIESLVIGNNYGRFSERDRVTKQNSVFIRADSGTTDGTGVATVAHDMGDLAWGAIAQTSPAGGVYAAVTSVDAANVYVQFRDINTWDTRNNDGPWLVDLHIFGREWST